MKKKILSLLLLPTLAIGLGSCKTAEDVPVEPEKPVCPECPKPEPVEVPVHHHHYGISVDAREGITVTVEKLGEAGKDIKVKAEVAEGSEFTISGIEAGEGVEVKASETAGEWTFKMPERPVTIKVNTSDILHPITITDPDAAKGKLVVADEAGAPITEAPAGTQLVAKYVGTDATVREGNVKLGETALAFDPTVGGYKFTVPSGGAAITYELVAAVYRLSHTNDAVTTVEGTEGAQFTLSLSSQTADYEDYKEEVAENEQYSIGRDRVIDITIYPIEGATLKITSIKLGAEELEFEAPMYPGAPYTASGIMPAGDAVLDIITEEIPTVAVTYVTDSFVTAYVDKWDDNLGDSVRQEAPRKALVGGTYTAMAEISDPTRGIDESLSGVYLEDGTKVEGGIDVTGSMITIYGPETIDQGFQVRLFTKAIYDLNGLTGTWAARRTYGYKTGETSIQIQSDGSFTFAHDDTGFSSAKLITGSFTISEDGSYHWDNAPTETLPEPDVPAVTAETEPAAKPSSLDIWPAFAEDGSIRWLNARYYSEDTEKTYESYLTAGFRGEVYKDYDYEATARPDTVLRYFQTSATEGGWVRSTAEKMETITVSHKDAENKKVQVTADELEKIGSGEIYELKAQSGPAEFVKYKGTRDLKFAGEERDNYRVKGGSYTDPKLELDGFGGYKFGEVTGTYRYNPLTKAIILTAADGTVTGYTDVTKYISEIEARELGAADALSGLTYEIPTNGKYSLKKLTFIDAETVKVGSESAFHSYDPETKTATVRTFYREQPRDLVVTLGDDLSITCVSGKFVDSDDQATKVYQTSTIAGTFAPAATETATDSLVITGGETPTVTIGSKSGSYTLERSEEGLKVLFSGRKYVIDLTAKTYTAEKVDVTWVNAASATYKMAESTYGTTDEGWTSLTAPGAFGKVNGTEYFTNIELSFDATGAKVASITVTNSRVDSDYYGDSLTRVGTNTWKNCEYTVDADALTLTITLNDTEAAGQTIVFDIDATTKSLVSHEGTYERTNTNNSVVIAAGLRVNLK